MALSIARRCALAKAPKAIVFDTDNTLYRYDEPHARATGSVEAKVMRQLGVSAEHFRDAFAKARDEVKRRLGHQASSHSRLLYFQQTIEMLGMRTQLLLTLDLEQTYWRTFLSEAQLFPGVKDLLQDLRSAGIPTAIITDLTSQIQFRKIIYFGLDSLFDFIVTSEEAGADKPHPAPFRLLLEKLNVAPEDVWMIGDNPVCDIQGARAMGMWTAQKIHPGVTVGRGDTAADITFEHFPELRSLLEQQFGLGLHVGQPHRDRVLS